jgi:hypothetical protein
MANSIVRVRKSIIHRVLLLVLLTLLLHCLLFGKFVLQNLVVFVCILFDLFLSLLIEIILQRVIHDEAIVCFRKLSTLINDSFDFVKICIQVLACVRSSSPSCGFVNKKLQSTITDHDFLVVFVVLLSENRVVLRRLKSKVIEQLQPQTLQSGRVSFEEIKVIPDCG